MMLKAWNALLHYFGMELGSWKDGLNVQNTMEWREGRNNSRKDETSKLQNGGKEFRMYLRLYNTKKKLLSSYGFY